MSECACMEKNEAAYMLEVLGNQNVQDGNRQRWWISNSELWFSIAKYKWKAYYVLFLCILFKRQGAVFGGLGGLNLFWVIVLSTILK
ncbi:hypothetical protein Hanom_Chr10g00954471 [Helianthus anomalus]